MTPSDVIDARGDLCDRLEDQKFRNLQDSFGNMEFGRSGGIVQEGTTSQSTMMHALLSVAETYKVTHDMSLMVQMAAEELDDTDQFDWQLAPSRAGFCAFDRPLPVLDQRGKTMLIHYIMWGPAQAGAKDNYHPCTVILTYNDRWRQPDEIEDTWESSFASYRAQEHGRDANDEDLVFARKDIEKISNTMGRWAPIGTNLGFQQMRVGPKLVVPSPNAMLALAKEGLEPTAGTNVVRYLHALWLLMNQTMVTKHREEADRPARRRAQRRKMKQTGVTVIKLRRESNPYEPKHGESHIEWSHRWLVRGHWRWNVCGKDHALAQEVSPGVYRARLWVSPYVKGPDNAPFVVKEKVISLER